MAHEAVFYLAEAKDLSEKAAQIFIEIFPHLEEHYLVREVFNIR